MKWYNFNGVGDYVYDQIDGKNYTTLRYTGPLKPWTNSGLRRNTTKFYSCNYKYSTFSEIKIDYTDGTSTTIKNSEFNLYTELTGWKILEYNQIYKIFIRKNDYQSMYSRFKLVIK